MKAWRIHGMFLLRLFLVSVASIAAMQVEVLGLKT